MNQSRTENTIRNTVAAMLLQVVLILARFSTQTVFIYTLGKQYTGVACVFSDLLLMLSGAELGIGAAVLFSLYQPISENNEEKIYAYISLLKKVYHAVALVVILIGVLILPFLSYIIKDVPDIRENIKLIFFLFVLKSSCSYLLSYRSILFEAYQQKRIISLLSCGITILMTIFQILVLLLTRQYLLFLLIDITGVLLKNTCISVVSYRKYPMAFRSKELSLSKEERSSVWNNVGALSLYRFSRIALDGTDSVIISTFLGTPLVSLLVGYRMVINYIADFAGQFFHSALPSVGNAVATESEDHNFRLFERLNFALFAITCTTGTCLFIMLTPFVYLWLGAEYCFTVPVVASLVLNYYTSMMMIVNTTFRNGYGLYVKGFLSPAIMAVLNIGLSLLLAKPFGILGILIATSIARLATQLWVDPVLLYRYAFHKNMNSYWKEFGFRIAVTILSCALSWKITWQLPNTLIMLFVRLLVAVVVSFCILWVLYGRKEEFTYTMRMIKKICQNIYSRFRRLAKTFTGV